MADECNDINDSGGIINSLLLNCSWNLFPWPKLMQRAFLQFLSSTSKRKTYRLVTGMGFDSAATFHGNKSWGSSNPKETCSTCSVHLTAIYCNWLAYRNNACLYEIDIFMLVLPLFPKKGTISERGSECPWNTRIKGHQALWHSLVCQWAL